ncbi:MAG: aminoacyl-tRNA hydrolase [Buchnera aphidicola (Meitanaphis flavogallis)]
MIVGLANPIVVYDKTRHNVGSWFIQTLARHHNQTLKEDKKLLGYTGSFFCVDFKVRLFIPNVFMNLSGKSIFIISRFYRIALDEILIIHDELDLNPGCIKLKFGCGHNGHNGIRNIINVWTKKNNFLRMQIGIGRPEKKKTVADFVLSPPTLEEKRLIEKSIFHAIYATNLLIQEKNVKIAQEILKNKC